LGAAQWSEDVQQRQMENGAGVQVRRPLLKDHEAAALLGVGERTFADLIRESWMPSPIVLGPRLRRWDADELLVAVRNRAPRGENKAAEPAQLRRARIDKLKAGAGAKVATP
jgi:predicted DNA-binding transcriptional regulator AlpA